MEVIYGFFTSLAGVCVCVAAGSAVGKIPLPFSGVPIGWTAGTLTVSAVFGYYGGKRALLQKCSELLRGIGLMLFFVGTVTVRL